MNLEAVLGLLLTFLFAATLPLAAFYGIACSHPGTAQKERDKLEKSLVVALVLNALVLVALILVSI